MQQQQGYFKEFFVSTEFLKSMALFWQFLPPKLVETR